MPATFQIELDSSINYTNPQTGTNVLWTNAKATEHFGEYIGTQYGGENFSTGIRSQEMLESYSAALNEAMTKFVSLPSGEHSGIFGGWEIAINTETGVVFHAFMLG